MFRISKAGWLLCALLAAPGFIDAQESQPKESTSEVRLRVVSSLPGNHRAVPGVAWLTPLPGTEASPFSSQARYTLLQKNRAFHPHLQVIPVGAVVEFPNADPFYHNVFSLFEGKRFDLGLYESGSSKSVTFPREGVSYIFCNIHPEMSAVVLALSTSLYAVADSSEAFMLHKVPAGEYKLHIWIEGVPQPALDGLARIVHVGGHDFDIGTISAPIAQSHGMTHMNKFGNPYDTKSQPAY
jgi:plastocyanin